MRAAWTASIQLRSRRSYSRARSFQWFCSVPRVAGRDGSMRLTGQRIALEGTEPARTGLGTSVTMHDEPVGLHRTFGRGFTGPECIRSARKISCCPVSALCSSALATAPSGQRCAGAVSLRQPASGGVAEWPKALVLKTSEPRGSVGSNPTPPPHYAINYLIILEIPEGYESCPPGSIPERIETGRYRIELHSRLVTSYGGNGSVGPCWG